MLDTLDLIFGTTLLGKTKNQTKVNKKEKK